jgi:hypothetical protein
MGSIWSIPHKQRVASCVHSALSRAKNQEDARENNERVEEGHQA